MPPLRTSPRKRDNPRQDPMSPSKRQLKTPPSSPPKRPAPIATLRASPLKRLTSNVTPSLSPQQTAAMDPDIDTDEYDSDYVAPPTSNGEEDDDSGSDGYTSCVSDLEVTSLAISDNGDVEERTSSHVMDVMNVFSQTPPDRMQSKDHLKETMQRLGQEAQLGQEAMNVLYEIKDQLEHRCADMKGDTRKREIFLHMATGLTITVMKDEKVRMPCFPTADADPFIVQDTGTQPLELAHVMHNHPWLQSRGDPFSTIVPSAKCELAVPIDMPLDLHKHNKEWCEKMQIKYQEGVVDLVSQSKVDGKNASGIVTVIWKAFNKTGFDQLLDLLAEMSNGGLEDTIEAVDKAQTRADNEIDPFYKDALISYARALRFTTKKSTVHALLGTYYYVKWYQHYLYILKELNKTNSDAWVRFDKFFRESNKNSKFTPTNAQLVWFYFANVSNPEQLLNKKLTMRYRAMFNAWEFWGYTGTMMLSDSAKKRFQIGQSQLYHYLELFVRCCHPYITTLSGIGELMGGAIDSTNYLKVDRQKFASLEELVHLLEKRYVLDKKLPSRWPETLE